MKQIYYIVFFCLLLLLGMGVFQIQNIVALERISLEEERLHKYKIHVDKPNIAEEKLRVVVEDFLENQKQEFLRQLPDATIQPEFVYTLDITYQRFFAMEYESYLFQITIYTGGAHPNTTLQTFVYNHANDEFVTIDTFLEDDEEFLVNVSKSVRSDLLYNPKITNTAMMWSGTESQKENFEHFVIVKQGLLFYFEPYQVAPYASGVLNAYFSLERELSFLEKYGIL